MRVEDLARRGLGGRGWSGGAIRNGRSLVLSAEGVLPCVRLTAAGSGTTMSRQHTAQPPAIEGARTAVEGGRGAEDGKINPSPDSKHFDVLIVGAGPAGLNAALVLGRMRRRVLVVDTDAPAHARSENRELEWIWC
jgi:NADPH-dependent 2,4-dienoyl-CoA reductase/sulfur reductase-like enzyme